MHRAEATRKQEALSLRYVRDRPTAQDGGARTPRVRLDLLPESGPDTPMPEVRSHADPGPP